MSPLFVPLVVCCAFLMVGSVVFVASLAVRWTRRFALSAALWCVVWGPCLLAWMMFAGLIGIVARFGLDRMPRGQVWNHLPAWQAGLGIGLLGLAVLSTAAVATLVAWLHQSIVRRMTFALFRVYAAFVSAGVGSVWGWAASIWIGVAGVRFGLALGAAAMAALVGGFGYGAFRWARELRGKAPERFAWVTPEEFEGVR